MSEVWTDLKRWEKNRICIFFVKYFSKALLILFKIKFFVFFIHSAIEIINFVYEAKHNLQEIRERVVKVWQVIYILSWREYTNRYLYAYTSYVPHPRLFDPLLIWIQSWLWTADFRPTFPCLVHKLSVILTVLDYHPHWKMG